KRFRQYQPEPDLCLGLLRTDEEDPLDLGESRSARENVLGGVAIAVVERHGQPGLGAARGMIRLEEELEESIDLRGRHRELRQKLALAPRAREAMEAERQPPPVETRPQETRQRSPIGDRQRPEQRRD